MRLSVLIVGDGDEALDLARQLAQADGRVFDVATYTAAELTRGVQAGLRPDVLLIDIAEFPAAVEAGGVVAYVRRCWPAARLLAFGEANLQSIIAAVRCRADGYVHRTANTREIVKTIHRAVSTDDFVLPSSLVTAYQAVTAWLPSETHVQPALHDLTPRERDIATLAASGLSNRELSDCLQISEETVKWHLKNVLRKLDVGGRRQLRRRWRRRITRLDAPEPSVSVPAAC